MHLLQKLYDFNRLQFAHSGYRYTSARVYILLVQATLLLSVVLFQFETTWFNRHVIELLYALQFMSILLHTLVCSVIGIDKLYILHLIFSGIMDITVMFSEVFKIENSNYLVYISCIIAIFSYWIFNIRTRILYLYQFRFAVKNTNISKETLFQKLFKWWVLVHLILIPYIILTISISDTVSDYYWNFMCALCVAFELKMYLALTPENESWNYVFFNKDVSCRKILYIFCIILHHRLDHWFNVYHGDNQKFS